MAAATSTSWKGALDFAGINVNVRLYGRVKSRSSDSFKTIAPNGLPIKSVMQDTEGKPVDRSEVRKGVVTGKDTYAILSPEAINSIKEGGKSVVVEPGQFCPLDSVPLDLAINSYVVVPDKDTPGAERSAGVLWNGLLDSGLAYVTDVTMTGGGRDSILVVYARAEGLAAVTLPYEAELNEVPHFDFQRDSKQGEVFSQFINTAYAEQLGQFDHGAHVSEYRTRRQAAIDAALTGEPVQQKAPVTPKDSTPDLMAVLEAAVAKAPKKKAPAKKDKVTA